MHKRAILPVAGLLTALGATLGAPAHAQFGPFSKPKIEIGAPGLPTDATDKQTLGEVNKCAQTGMNAMPGGFGSNYEKKAEAMAEAKPYYDQCKALFATVVNGKNEEGATRRWKEFELAYDNGVLEIEVLRAAEPVAKSQENDVPVTDPDLDAIDAAQKAFAKGCKGDDAKRSAKIWGDKAKGFRETNKKLLERHAAEKAQAESAAALKHKNDIIDGLEALVAKADAIAKDDKAPIGADVLDGFEPLLKEADAWNPSARIAYGHDLWAFKAYNAWFDAKPHAAVAAAIGGAVAAEGTLTTKVGKVKVKGAADTCYALMGRFAGGTGQERWDADPSDDKNWMKRQGFVHWARGTDVKGQVTRRYWLDGRGACTMGAHDFEIEVKLEFPGSKASFEWMVVSWPKAAMPNDVLYGTATINNDDCDAIHYKEVFTHPFPKLTYYAPDGTPLVYQSIEDWNARTADRGNPRVSKPSVTPDKLRLPTPSDIGSCPESSAEPNPAVKAYGVCLDKLAKQYGPQVESASNAVSNARTISAEVAAERRLQGLREAWGKAESAQCDPLKAKLQKAMDAATVEVADWWAKEKPTFDDGLLRFIEALDVGKRHVK